MEITIHRGIDQIGGCITEIATASSKILIDLGHNLPEGDSPAIDDKANEEVIEKLTKNCDGIFYTHYHGDHVDLFKYVPSHIKQYIGKVAKQVMLCKYETLSLVPALQADCPQVLQKLNAFSTFRANQKIVIGNITITPYWVSHSACDAFMFLIEADGKRILHTGDFRTHGYLGKGLLPTLQKYILKGGNIDVLITEGTMLSRAAETVKHEKDLEQEMSVLMKQYAYVFVLCSSTDIDRLATAYQASKANNRSYLCDSYQKNVLEIFSKTIGEKTDLYKFDEVHYYKRGHIRQLDLIKKKGFCMLVRSKHIDQVKVLLEQLPKEETLLIYSMWSGYILKGKHQKQEYVNLCNLFAHKVNVHTSGHASPEAITNVCNLIYPTTAIIPIHSEHSDALRDLALSNELKDRIVTSSVIKKDISIRIENSKPAL